MLQFDFLLVFQFSPVLFYFLSVTSSNFIAPIFFFSFPLTWYASHFLGDFHGLFAVPLLISYFTEPRALLMAPIALFWHQYIFFPAAIFLLIFLAAAHPPFKFSITWSSHLSYSYFVFWSFSEQRKNLKILLNGFFHSRSNFKITNQIKSTWNFYGF